MEDPIQRKFNKDGYFLIYDAVDEKTCDQLRDLIDSQDKAHERTLSHSRLKRDKKDKRHTVHKRLFEVAPELCLDVFKNEKITSVVRRLICTSGSGRNPDGGLRIHVIHNNAFCVEPGGRGQAPGWHQDDAPLYKTTNGLPLPDCVIVSPITLTCMIYLNDVNGPVDGMTHVIPGSHRFGIPCTAKAAETYECVAPSVKKGTVLVINSSVWHRGCSVDAEKGHARYVFQVTYGRRMVGHKHGSIMNYQLPNNVMDCLKTEEDREIMGFLQGGAYS